VYHVIERLGGLQPNVRQSFASGDWTGKSRSAPSRRGVAALGIFSILLQAVLFGWHHHPLPLPSRGEPTALVAAPPAGPSTPALTDDDCQICFALGHHSATPVDFVAAPVSAPVPLDLAAVETVWVPVRSYVLFRSRAPPRA
jgi:hypothetical protein